MTLIIRLLTSVIIYMPIIPLTIYEVVFSGVRPSMHDNYFC